MSSSSDSPEARSRYVVPRYSAPDDAVWYHVLHGTVPRHQIDFMYCPEVPHGAFTQNHFGHLARLMKYIEPRERAPYAFALGNLSRDDVQHEPGHGGVALILGLRVQGVLDHAGRAMPPYAHAILAVDRALDQTTLRDAALALHQRLLPGGRGPHQDTSDRLYRRYARAVRHHPGTVEGLLRRHIDGFTGLPRPAPSRLGWSFIAGRSAPPQRITITHADDAPFERLAHTMARLGAMLYRSNIKWTTISSGREFDIPGGVSVRLVPESEAIPDPAGLVVPIDAVPEDEATMARALFGASPRAAIAVPARVGWRERDAAKKAAEAAESEKPAPIARHVCATIPLDLSFLAGRDALEDEGEARAPFARTRLWLGLGAAGAGVCAMAALAAMISDPASAPARAALPSSPPANVEASPSPPAGDAGSWAPPGRFDIFPPPMGGPRSAIRRPVERATPSPPRSTSPRAPTSENAPGAIGGKPRF